MNQLSSTLVLDVAGLGLATAIIIQVVKGFLPLSPANPNQNNIVRGLVYLVAIGVVAFYLWTQYALNTRADILRVVTAGFTVGSFAIATYHLVTDAAPSAPAAQPAEVPVESPVLPVVVPEDAPAA